jgi:hypothetical protein
LLALVDLPDFGTPLGRIASSLERIADRPAADPASDAAKSRLPSIRARPTSGAA